MTAASKKAIASVAALQILVYHCVIPVFPYGTFAGSVERFLISATYPGVDIFFFISAYSLVSRPVENYRGFIYGRAVKLLPLFAIALALGQFLWFIPAIMLVYLVLPPLHRICRKNPLLSLVLLVIGWVGTVYLVLGVLWPSRGMEIFLLRIPSVILGAYAVRYREAVNPRRSLVAGSLLLVSGIALIYLFGYRTRLNYPFPGTFYLTGIPAMLGTVLLVDVAVTGRRPHLADRPCTKPDFTGRSCRRPHLTDWFGSMTLELYFTQMVLGTFLVTHVFSLTRNRLVTNLTVMTLIITIATLVRHINDRLVRLLQNK